MTPLNHLLTAPAERPHAAEPDPVPLWNDQTNPAIEATEADPFAASRALAMESLAVFNTIQSIVGMPAPAG